MDEYKQPTAEVILLETNGNLLGGVVEISDHKGLEGDNIPDL